MNLRTAVTAAVVCLTLGLAPAQTLPKLLPAKTAAATDPFGRDTPRSTVYGLLEACHARNYAKAAQYLDTSGLQTAAVADRARELGLILDRDPHFELEQLDNTPQGRLDDSLAGDIEKLDTLELNGRPVTLYLQRVHRDNIDIWLVSRDSVQRIPQLAASMGESPLEKKLPAVLVDHTLLDTPLWVWLGLALAAAILALLSRVLSRLAIAIVKPAAKRYLNSVPAFRLQAFTGPVRLLVSVAVFRAVMEFVAPGALLRDFILHVLTLLWVMGSASLLMRFVDLIADRWMSRLNAQERTMSHSVLPLAVRIIKICLFCLAVLATLRQWGFDITAVLAGVGVGSLAVALAAQRTIENFFGGISVISDRPVLVGDTCQFSGQIGVVEDIGLRSTRIRTYDRTLVTIPNSQFSTMTLENYSRRDRFWFHPALQLRRDNTPEKIEAAMQAIGRVLADHPKVDPTAVPVRFTKILPEAFVLEVFAYVLTSDGTEFVRIQSELLLKILRELAAAEVKLSVPFQDTLNVAT